MGFPDFPESVGPGSHAVMTRNVDRCRNSAIPHQETAPSTPAPGAIIEKYLIDSEDEADVEMPDLLRGGESDAEEVYPDVTMATAAGAADSSGANLGAESGEQKENEASYISAPQGDSDDDLYTFDDLWDEDKGGRHIKQFIEFEWIQDVQEETWCQNFVVSCIACHRMIENGMQEPHVLEPSDSATGTWKLAPNCTWCKVCDKMVHVVAKSDDPQGWRTCSIDGTCKKCIGEKQHQLKNEAATLKRWLAEKGKQANEARAASKDSYQAMNSPRDHARARTDELPSAASSSNRRMPNITLPTQPGPIEYAKDVSYGVKEPLPVPTYTYMDHPIEPPMSIGPPPGLQPCAAAVPSDMDSDVSASAGGSTLVMDSPPTTHRKRQLYERMEGCLPHLPS